MTEKTQQAMFAQINIKFSSQHDLVEKIKSLLGISKSGVYDRINGKQILRFDEAIILCQTFDISLDTLILDRPTHLNFQHPRIMQQVVSIDEYLGKILELLRQVRKIPNAKIWYSSAEIPIFHYMYFPDLVAFKIFVWGRTVWNIPEFQQSKIKFETILTPTHRAMLEDLLDLFNQIPSVFYFPSTVLHNTLNQLKFFQELKIFEETQIFKKIKQDIHSLVELQQEMAKKQLKINPKNKSSVEKGNFQLYWNEMFQTSNLILIENDYQPMVFLTFDTPNFIVSSDKIVYDYTIEWFEKIRRSSTAITQSNERERTIFFNKMLGNLNSFDF